MNYPNYESSKLQQESDFILHLQRQKDWSTQTFGPGRRLNGVLDHMAKEIEEVRESDGDLSEWVDLIILALDGAWRSGATPTEVVNAIKDKQQRNELRTWPDWREGSEDHAIEHIRDSK